MGAVTDETQSRIHQKIVTESGIELRSLEQSRVRDNCALFASCGREAFETAYNIRDG